MTTRLTFLTLLAAGAALSAPACAADSISEDDCFPTPQAVLAAHPDAAHVSWARGTSPRCWFANSFRTGPQAGTAPRRHAARPQPPRPAETAAPAAAGEPQPHVSAAAPRTPLGDAPPVPPAPVAVPQQASRLFPDDDGGTADFDSRFSASGFRR